MPSRLFALVLAAAWSACSTAPSPPPHPAEAAYTLVLLKTGPRTAPLTAEERSRIFGGHFANMGRLSRAGDLLLAGPFGQTRSDPALRGIFVLDTADPARARELAESDPGFREGVFALHYHPLATAAALRAQRLADLAAHDAIVASGRTPQPGEGGRSYVLLTATDGEDARGALAHHPAVLLAARLDGTRALFLLDAANVAAARERLGAVTGRLGAFTLDEWFGSGLLVELPKRTG